ncbi:MAG TPA: adenine phosphoribosyltransferase [bacterium]|nr:adenine phosphoribosyltransferase [bacterium]
MDLKSLIRDIPDFPKKGIIFKDITPILGNKDAFRQVIDTFADRYKDKGVEYIVGVEARGFIFASALALRLNVGFVPVRKPKKLPWATHRVEYELEYGTDALEIHQDAVPKGSKVVLLDDLLATGGTTAATLKLLQKLDAKVIETAFVIELGFLKGREKLKDCPVYAMIRL